MKKGPRYSAMGRVIVLLLSVDRSSAFLEKLKKYIDFYVEFLYFKIQQ